VLQRVWKAKVKKMRESDFFLSPWALYPQALPFIAEKWSDLRASQASVLPLPLQKNTLDTQGQIAVLAIHGIILPYASAFARLVGATCLDALTDDFCDARDNPAITTIVLDIDSPGGLVTGVHAFSQLVFAARPLKPIIARVSGMAASAAYWIAASASQILVDPTASLGSIGVVMTSIDTTEQEKKEGRTRIEIVSQQSPYKRVPATSEEGRAQLQAQVDQLAAVFVEAVALYRAVAVSTVLSDFGQGGLLVGSAAVTQGLADGLHSLSDLLSPFSPSTIGVSLMTPSNNVENNVTIPPPPLVAEGALPAGLPQQEALGSAEASYAQGFQAGLSQGRTQEWERLRNIEAHSLPGYEPLIDALKADGVSTGSDAAVQIQIAQKMQRAQLDADLREDAPPSLPPLQELPSVANLPLESQCAAEWERSAAVRAEFHSLAGYTAYRKAEARGLCGQSQAAERRNHHAQ
jgi:ClpP class serine protease